MKIVNLLNFRNGLATNSSSTHSVIYKNKEDMFEDLNIFELDYYGRCDETIAASRNAKIKYLFGCIFYDDELSAEFLKKYPEAEQYKELAEVGKKDWEAFGNHSRGRMSLANNIEFSMKFLSDVIEDENKIIIGGSDELDFVYDTIEGHKEVEDPSDVHGIDCIKQPEPFNLTKEIYDSYLYKNGNYYVGFGYDCHVIGSKFSKGRIRFSFNNENPIPERPELVDLKITNKCMNNCKMCFANSGPNGEHADINELCDIIDNISSNGTNIIEYSIGGGNILEYPHLEEMFKKIKETHGIICVTIKANDCNTVIDNESILELFRTYVDGVGVSVFTKNDIDILAKFDKCINDKNKRGSSLISTYTFITAHMIPEYLGVEKTKEILNHIKSATNTYIPVLYLGYKSLGRGEKLPYATLSEDDLNTIFGDNYIFNIDTLFANRYNDWIVKNFRTYDKTITFNEGEYSMYIDAVEGLAYKSSYDTNKPYRIKDYNSITEIFNNIRKDNGFEIFE